MIEKTLKTAKITFGGKTKKWYQMPKNGYKYVRRNTHQPKPKENVKFFIYNVDGQNANGIVGLHGAGWTVFEERTFGHSWKYLSHGIDSCLRIILQETQCAYSVGAKMAQKV